MKSLHLLLQRLADANFEFVVIGGFAGVLHHSSLVTNDLNLCAVLSPETEGGTLDILSHVADLGDYQRLRQNALLIPLFGRSRPVISLEDLITAKHAQR